jgi:hypothetical protein
MPKYILSIDPGTHTGVAIFEDGKLINLHTDTPYSVLERIAVGGWHKVIFEDSTLQSHVFTAPSVKGAAKLKIARNIGEVDGYCKLIKLACESVKTPWHAVSPKNKGAKLSAEQFNKLTGWDNPSNQHQRDAGMSGWAIRRAA